MRLLAALLIVTSLCHAQDHELEGDGVYAQILGHSGKIRLSRDADVASGGNESDADAVTFQFVKLQEVDAGGNAVGDSGQNKHSFNTFASTDFEFSDISWGHMGNVSYQLLVFSANGLLLPTTNLTVELRLFNESGTITNGDESFDVEEGDVKFSVTVSGWPFCTAAEDGGNEDALTLCEQGQTEEVGEFLEISIESKYKQSESEEPIGEVHWSRLVLLDGDSWRDLPEHFPAVAQQGSKDIVTLRFPRFNSSAYYDPVIHLFEEGESEADTEESEDEDRDLIIGLPVALGGALLLTIAGLLIWRHNKKRSGPPQQQHQHAQNPGAAPAVGYSAAASREN